jgi:hypothetical protein
MAETTGLSTALPGLIDYYIREIAWGPNAATATQLTPNALCTGAGKRTTIMRFDDGRAVSFRASSTDTGPVMVYEFLDDHTLTMNDGNQNLEGTLTVTFRIEGDNLSFDQGSERADQDPWGGTQLEVAPFVRVN